jgi:murein DD-endopeptidase MepM/ murein hydrolase activator NlpD
LSGNYPVLSSPGYHSSNRIQKVSYLEWKKYLSYPDFQISMHKSGFVLLIFILLGCTSLFGGVREGGSKDTVRILPSFDRIEALSEKELISLIDSLISEKSIPCDLIVKINNLISDRESHNPKNDFANFSVYPSESVYGNWDTKKLFPYSNELSKHDTTYDLLLVGGSSGKFVSPVDGHINSAFGWRDSSNHQGIDLELRRGDPVRCAFDGMVRVAMRSYGGYGNVVIVRHYNGLETLYAHLNKIKVKPGEFVFAGQELGLGGSTGRSTGAHLHFETRFKGVPINPKYFISFDSHDLVSSSIELKKTRWGYAAYPINTDVYTIQKGDNLYELSRQFATSVANLKELNGFTRYPRLKAGDKLVIRKQREGKF